MPVTLLWIVRTVDEFTIFSEELISYQRSFENLRAKVWITLSAPEPNYDDERLLKENMLQLSKLEQAQHIVQCVKSYKKKHEIHNPSSRMVTSTFSLDQEGFRGTFNAIVMSIAIFLGLYAYALVSKMSQSESMEDTVQDNISLMELAMVYVFILSWIGLAIAIKYHLSRYQLGVDTVREESMILNQKIKSLNMSDGGISTSDSGSGDNLEENEDIQGMDLEESNSDNFIQSMIQGHIGCRPNLSKEFASATEVMENDAGKSLELAVLACGPGKLLQSINSIINVPSNPSIQMDLGQGIQAHFIFTEEDWEW